ncbi:hypothetical protein BOX15_Mlig007799g2 [Macrostomum lignano]|uniref:BZIP domain-containing protein n=1 Tax=Macrostomum lignano TaxID=282301 RepID=A0A267EEF0_9PLAT|nr:hypothetical protein BOX15_Mlig007799g4 [Macrostomum lignano]PAA59229.1 hypothetical protein BOX15_Mlig007799g2 [Macrostomum lignano]
MVKSLKFLRHRRTDTGYFSEFLIAKTPNDLENREPQQQIVLAAAPAVQQPLQHQQLAMVPAAIDLQAWPASQEVVISSAAAVAPQVPPQQAPRPAAASLNSYRLARRRERNRAAAAKCRQRRQDRLETLADCVRDLEAANGDLEAEVAELAAARAQLEAQLRSHRAHCQLPGPMAADADDSQFLSSSPSSPSSVWLAAPPTPQTPHEPPQARRPASLSLQPAPPPDSELPSLTTPRGCGSGLTPFLLTPQSAVKLETACMQLSH